MGGKTKADYSRENLENVVKECYSTRQVAFKLGLRGGGGLHKIILRKIKEFDIDISHFSRSKCSNKQSLPYTEVLVYGVSIHSTRLRQALLDYGRIEECEVCKNTGVWNEVLLRLEIHHKDRDRKNNNPDNLAFLCPNCHSQMPGHTSNINELKIKKKRSRYPLNQKKIDSNISKEQLQKLVNEKPISQLANYFNISKPTMYAWCKNLGVTTRSRGYWTNKTTHYESS